MRNGNDVVSCRIRLDQVAESLRLLGVQGLHCRRVGEEVTQHLIIDTDGRLALDWDVVQSPHEVDEARRGLPVQCQQRLELRTLWICGNLLQADLSDPARVSGDLKLELLATTGRGHDHPLLALAVGLGLEWLLVEHLGHVARHLPVILRGAQVEFEASADVDAIGESAPCPGHLVGVEAVFEGRTGKQCPPIHWGAYAPSSAGVRKGAQGPNERVIPNYNR